MYARRSKVDPLWNSFVLGGVDPKSGERFLGFVDLLGTTYQSPTIATGFGAHLAQPLLRRAVEGKEDELTEDQAREILESCMQVLCEYRFSGFYSTVAVRLSPVAGAAECRGVAMLR